MKKIFFSLVVFAALTSCNSPEQNSTVGNSEDSTTIRNDDASDSRGTQGAGVDNSGGTSGAGTITDTSKGKVDTLDHKAGK